jgi:hypothetical protein
MAQTPVDYTIFWRELSSLPKQLADLHPSCYASRGVRISGHGGQRFSLKADTISS